MNWKRCILPTACFALGAGLAWAGRGSEALEAAGAGLAALGRGLRRLSLSGGGGNALAWALLLALGLLPLLGLLPAKRRKSGADWLWPAAAVYALAMLYALVNPHLLRGWLYPAWAWDEGVESLCALILFGPLAALIIAALTLRLARADASGGVLLRRLGAFLAAAQCLAAFASGARLPGIWRLTGGDLVLGIIDAAAGLAEFGALMAALGAGHDLTAGLAQGWLRDENGPLADCLAVWARRMLAVDVAAMLVRRFAVLLLGARLTNLNMSVAVSLDGILIALSALALARFVREGVRVRRENDEFI